VNARDRLELALSPQLLDALDEYVRDVVDGALRDKRARAERGDWVPLAVAADRMGCSTDAVRMRVNRKTIEARRQGRRIYVRLDGATSDNGSVPSSTANRAPARRRSPGA
jgi:hypothetical protein